MAKAAKEHQGCKGKYHKWLTEDGLFLLESWSRDGLTKEQIARDKMHIAPSTLAVWENKYTEISEAIKKGREFADYVVENALFKSACGFYVQENDKERYIPPSQTAQIFWLKNRRPDKYADHPAPAPSAVERESDGLIEALTAKAAELFGDGDDSDILPEDGGAK